MVAAEVTEIKCKSLINHVNAPDFPFNWTINTYRGCRHACRYCYARSTHQYWGMDAGADFDRQIFAKVNAAAVLRDELSRPKWAGEAIAIGTASDPYEPAEAQYALTRQVLEVLVEFRNPASITTKGTLVRRDIDLLRRLNEVAGTQVVFSVGTIDETIWRQTEPGAPHPMARLEAMQYLVEHGIPAGVMAAPLLPGLSDSAQSINVNWWRRWPRTGPNSCPATCCSCARAAGSGLCRSSGRPTRTWPPDTPGCIATHTLPAITPAPC